MFAQVPNVNNKKIYRIVQDDQTAQQLNKPSYVDEVLSKSVDNFIESIDNNYLKNLDDKSSKEKKNPVCINSSPLKETSSLLNEKFSGLSKSERYDYLIVKYCLESYLESSRRFNRIIESIVPKHYAYIVDLFLLDEKIINSYIINSYKERKSRKEINNIKDFSLGVRKIYSVICNVLEKFKEYIAQEISLIKFLGYTEVQNYKNINQNDRIDIGDYVLDSHNQNIFIPLEYYYTSIAKFKHTELIYLLSHMGATSIELIESINVEKSRQIQGEAKALFVSTNAQFSSDHENKNYFEIQATFKPEPNFFTNENLLKNSQWFSNDPTLNYILSGRLRNSPTKITSYKIKLTYKDMNKYDMGFGVGLTRFFSIKLDLDFKILNTRESYFNVTFI